MAKSFNAKLLAVANLVHSLTTTVSVEMMSSVTAVASIIGPRFVAVMS
jgi:hypothetical protein